MSTKIEWTHCPDGKGGFKNGETWNAQVGCRELSPACRKCYAAKLAHRGMSPQHRGLTVLRKDGPHWNGEIKRVPHLLAQPLKWREQRGVFVGSMTDLFFKVDTDVDCEFIAAIFGIMAATPRHTYMLLTKRPENAARWFAWLAKKAEGFEDSAAESMVCTGLALDALTAIADGDANTRARDSIREARMSGLAWPIPHVWCGVTAEDQQRANERVPVLLSLPAAVRYVSYEPACGAVDFAAWLPRRASDVTDDACDAPDSAIVDGMERVGDRWEPRGPWLDQIIVGGESGPGARPSHPDWFRAARDQCVSAGVPFFFKQHGEWAEVARDDDGWTHMVSLTGKAYARGEEMPIRDVAPMAFMRKVGKAAAGSELDGRTWHQFPTESQR